jgi:hypothetical protein
LEDVEELIDQKRVLLRNAVKNINTAKKNRVAGEIELY